ncbi:hypothetical protein NB705_003473 [Xanthomonas sacchari]|nr:hypothetical protein [Xanthomonas sacchari]
MLHPAQQVHAAGQPRIGLDALLHHRQQRRIAERAEQLQPAQLLAGAGHAVEHGERILALAQMADPQHAGRAMQPAVAARLVALAGSEAATGFGNGEQARGSGEQSGADETARQLQRGEGDAGGGGVPAPPLRPPPPARRTVGVVLQQDRQRRPPARQRRRLARELQAVHVHNVGLQLGQQRGDAAQMAPARGLGMAHEVIVHAVALQLRIDRGGLDHRNAGAGAGHRLGDVGQRRPQRERLLRRHPVRQRHEVELHGMHGAVDVAVHAQIPDTCGRCRRTSRLARFSSHGRS